ANPGYTVVAAIEDVVAERVAIGVAACPLDVSVAAQGEACGVRECDSGRRRVRAGDARAEQRGRAARQLDAVQANRIGNHHAEWRHTCRRPIPLETHVEAVLAEECRVVVQLDTVTWPGLWRRRDVERRGARAVQRIEVACW